MDIVFEPHTGKIVAAGTGVMASTDQQQVMQVDTATPLEDLLTYYQVVDAQLVRGADSAQLDHATQLQRIRNVRDIYLKHSDWTQMPDTALSAEQQTAWQQYRQSLRDITAGLPAQMVLDYQPEWPQKPYTAK